jgi:hypothetical protein
VVPDTQHHRAFDHAAAPGPGRISTSPAQSLTIRGWAEIDEVDGLAPEYVASAHRYVGDVAAAEMLASMGQPGTVQARIVVRPTWVGLLDFATRLPSPLGGV